MGGISRRLIMWSSAATRSQLDSWNWHLHRKFRLHRLRDHQHSIKPSPREHPLRGHRSRQTNQTGSRRKCGRRHWHQGQLTPTATMGAPGLASETWDSPTASIDSSRFLKRCIFRRYHPSFMPNPIDHFETYRRCTARLEVLRRSLRLDKPVFGPPRLIRR
jgi:hypothetical protein